MLFTELGLDPDLLKSIQELEFDTCTEVQAKTFEHTFNGRDVVIQSKTGTGKTATFLISIFQTFQTKESNKFALILVPTRELAIQIEKEALAFAKYLNYKIATFYGGVGYKKQEMQLEEGVDIMIATPGRLIDFMKSGKINLSKVSYFVVDEADRMFDLGFSQDIEYITRKLPSTETRRTIFLSATINYKVKLFADKFIDNPVEIDLSPDTLMVEGVDHYLCHVSTDEKFNLLLGLITIKKPENAFIFTNTKHAAVLIAEKLKLHGINADYIIGDLPQAKRTRIINRIKNNEIQFLVATDVAARGIHVDNLDMVINYDLPEDPENYVHRVGRTARAGQTGVAYSFACEKFVYGLDGLETMLGKKIPLWWPEDELFVDNSEMDYSSIKMKDSRNKPGRHDRDRNQRGGKGQHSGKKAVIRKSSRNKSSEYQKGEQRGQNKSRKSNSQNSQNSQNFKQKQNKQNTQYKAKSTIKKTASPNKSAISPKRKHKLKTRLQMYEEKYGESFTVKNTPESRKKEGVFSKIGKKLGSIFSKKK
jgi:ATP-dependent RNA helicase RhlB